MLYQKKAKIRTLENLKDKFWSKNSVDEVNNESDLAEYQAGDARDKGKEIVPNSEHKGHLQTEPEGRTSV